jgi:hypothetical protein
MVTIDSEEKVREIIKNVEKSKTKFLEEEIIDYKFSDDEKGIDFEAIFWNKENTKKLVVKIIWLKASEKLIKCIVSSKKYALVHTIDYNSVISCVKDL